MLYNVVFYFDPPSEAIVQKMRQQLQSAGQKSNITESVFQPHVTLAVYDEKLSVTEQIKQEFATYSASIRPFLLTLSSVGIFVAHGVIFLGVTVTTALLNLRQTFYETFAHYLPYLEPNYADGMWVPHCTLAYGLSAAEIANVVPLCMQFALPVQLQVQRMEFANWQGNN